METMESDYQTAFEKVTLAAYDFGKFCKDNDYEFTSSSRFDNGYYEIVIVLHYKTPISEPEEDKLEKDIANCFTPHDITLFETMWESINRVRMTFGYLLN